MSKRHFHRRNAFEATFNDENAAQAIWKPASTNTAPCRPVVDSSQRLQTQTGTSTTIMAENDTIECVTEHERILQEIESTDTACVGPTLR